MSESLHRRIVVAGLGNLLMTDDGIGVHVVRSLSETAPPHVRILDVGTAILHALPELEEATSVLLVDAVEAGRAPGTIYRFDAAELDERPLSGSLHSMGLIDAMRALGKGWRSPEVTVIGVEPAIVAYGSSLSPTLQAVLPKATTIVRDILESWIEDKQPVVESTG